MYETTSYLYENFLIAMIGLNTSLTTCKRVVLQSRYIFICKNNVSKLGWIYFNKKINWSMYPPVLEILYNNLSGKLRGSDELINNS